MGILNSQKIVFTGKLGKIVSSKYNDIYVVRTWVKPTDPKTAAQQLMRGKFAYAVFLAQIAYLANRHAPAWLPRTFGEFGDRCGTANARLRAGQNTYTSLPLLPNNYTPAATITDFAVSQIVQEPIVENNTLYTQRMLNTSPSITTAHKLHFNTNLEIGAHKLTYRAQSGTGGIFSEQGKTLAAGREMFFYLFYTPLGETVEVFSTHISTIDANTGEVNFTVPANANTSYPIVLTGVSIKDTDFANSAIFVAVTNLNPNAPIQAIKEDYQWASCISSKELITTK